ncbi:MAG TPA: GNAT family N-acetyltransferase [Candidatus Sulfotelmatobacter sp.]|nr:GNAT family N-acetyltransferase [Candidatus Sulfotelmatobacter sp.]
MQINTANAAQAEAITMLINSAFRKAESFFIEGDRIDVVSIRALMEKGQFLVVDEAAQLRACVYVERRGERAYLGLLAVDSQLQNSGIGSALMNAAEDQCRQDGCCFMDLKIVNLRTDTHRFYTRRGYKETGTEPFPSHLTPKLPCHFVTMSKPLG